MAKKIRMPIEIFVVAFLPLKHLTSVLKPNFNHRRPFERWQYLLKLHCNKERLEMTGNLFGRYFHICFYLDAVNSVNYFCFISIFSAAGTNDVLMAVNIFNLRFNENLRLPLLSSLIITFGRCVKSLRICVIAFALLWWSNRSSVEVSTMKVCYFRWETTLSCLLTSENSQIPEGVNWNFRWENHKYLYPIIKINIFIHKHLSFFLLII